MKGYIKRNKWDKETVRKSADIIICKAAEVKVAKRSTECKWFVCRYSEAGFEAVEGRSFVVVLVPALAEEQSMFVEEEMSLHGFESGQFLHSHCCPFMADPHTEASLHHYTAQLMEITLSQRQ